MSAPATAEVIIIGGGVEGMSAAWALASRGVTDVAVFERDTVGSGGTGKSSGIVRSHYGVASLARMAWKGALFLEQAPEVLGADVGFHRTGYVVGVAPGDEATLAANLATHRSVGVQVDEISRSEVAALWPTARLDDFGAFAYEPMGGYGDAYQTAQAFSTGARRLGISLHQGSPVAAILTEDDRVIGVRLVDGSIVHAPHVVLAAGPWSVPLAAALGIDLPVRAMRESILLIDAGEPVRDVPVFSDLVSLQYIRTEKSGELLAGNSDLSVPEWADPDNYSNRADDDFVEIAAGKLAHRFPGYPKLSLASSYAGCYDVTPDFNPVIANTGPSGLTIASGFSGHGYKISPAVGELIADLITTGDSQDPQVTASDFRLERFAEGKPLLSPHPYTGAGQLR